MATLSSSLVASVLVLSSAALACVACGASESPAEDSPTSDDFTGVDVLDGYSTAPFAPAFSPGVLHVKLPKTLRQGTLSTFVGGAGLKARCDLVRTDTYRTTELVIPVGQGLGIDAKSFQFLRQTDGRAAVRAPIRPYPADPSKRVPLTLYCVSGDADMPTAALVEESLTKGGPYNGFAFTSSRPPAAAADAGVDAH
ncbi:MAG: hypothetical protein HOO96_07365 [Polyangiaceae bacterium]|nr:hypothetical protein [Polyangiaceae bacterium]